MREDEIDIEAIMDRPEVEPVAEEKPKRKKPDPYEKHLPLLVNDLKAKIRELSKESRINHKRYVIATSVAVTFGILLAASTYFLVSSYNRPLKEVAPFTYLTAQNAPKEAETTYDAPKAEEALDEVSEVAEAPKEEQPTAGVTEAVAEAGTQAERLLTFDLNGSEYDFPMSTEDLSANGWTVLGENPDEKNPELLVTSLYNEAGDGAYLYRTNEGEVTGFAVALSTEESSVLGVEQGMTLSQTDEIFYDAADRVLDGAAEGTSNGEEDTESQEGRGSATYIYGGYEIRVTFVNGGAASVEIFKN